MGCTYSLSAAVWLLLSVDLKKEINILIATIEENKERNNKHKEEETN